MRQGQPSSGCANDASWRQPSQSIIPLATFGLHSIGEYRDRRSAIPSLHAVGYTARSVRPRSRPALEPSPAGWFGTIGSNAAASADGVRSAGTLADVHRPGDCARRPSRRHRRLISLNTAQRSRSTHAHLHSTANRQRQSETYALPWKIQSCGKRRIMPCLAGSDPVVAAVNSRQILDVGQPVSFGEARRRAGDPGRPGNRCP